MKKRGEKNGTGLSFFFIDGILTSCLLAQNSTGIRTVT